MRDSQSSLEKLNQEIKQKRERVEETAEVYGRTSSAYKRDISFLYGLKQARNIIQQEEE